MSTDIEKPDGPEWRDRFLDALEHAGTIVAAAQRANVGRSTVYDELKRNAGFAADVKTTQEHCVDLVEASLYEAALLPGNSHDRAFYLRAMKPERYTDRLTKSQVHQIQTEARAATIKEFNAEIARLPDEPRRIVMAAINAMTAKELPAPATQAR